MYSAATTDKLLHDLLLIPTERNAWIRVTALNDVAATAYASNATRGRALILRYENRSLRDDVG